MITKWNIGCSGFYYKDWKDIFYPAGLPQKNWFEFYCSHFNTLEINNTFYRFPELKTLEGWYNRSPDNFIFSVKAPKLITHTKKFIATHEVLQNFYNLIHAGLKEKLGAVLFQFPASVHFSKTLLQIIVEQLSTNFTNVIEFRHQSWWQPEVFQTVSSNNIVFSGASFPLLPQQVIQTASSIYYRFHGVPKLYYSSYTVDFLTDVIQQIKQKNEVQKVYLYFNNTASAAALENAKFVQQTVK